MIGLTCYVMYMSIESSESEIGMQIAKDNNELREIQFRRMLGRRCVLRAHTLYRVHKNKRSKVNLTPKGDFALENT